MDKVNLFDLEFDNLTMNQVVNKLETLIEKKEKTFVVTPNVDHIVVLKNDPTFQTAYSKANLIIADGMPVVWASKLVGKPLKERVTGADLVPHLFKSAQKNHYKIFILGSDGNIVTEFIKKVTDEKGNSGITLDFYSPDFGFEKNEAENEKIVSLINQFSPDILLVSLGAPKGEKWISDHFESLNATVLIQVGAAIDFIADAKKRAPVWMRKTGFEWFYRFTQEPKRMFKRYFVQDMKFIPILLKELSKNKNKR